MAEPSLCGSGSEGAHAAVQDEDRDIEPSSDMLVQISNDDKEEGMTSSSTKTDNLPQEAERPGFSDQDGDHSCGTDQLSDFDRGQIEMARRLGQSVSKTASLVGCSRSAVISIYQKRRRKGLPVKLCTKLTDAFTEEQTTKQKNKVSKLKSKRKTAV